MFEEFWRQGGAIDSDTAENRLIDGCAIRRREPVPTERMVSAVDVNKGLACNCKLLVNRSNVRECFFQAVSNSSWANFGYLVAAEVEGQDTLKELRMLFAAHGIGLIKLDAENPVESQVLVPARERDEIDWDMANRLATENRDFLEYVKLVKQFYQTGEARLADWDVATTTN